MAFGFLSQHSRRDKDSLTGKAKAVHASKAKQGIHSPLPMGRQVFSHPQESRAPSHIMVTWEDKCHNARCPPFLPSSPSLYTQHDIMVWNIPLASSGQLSWLCPLPMSRAPPALSLAGPEKLKSPVWKVS